MGKIKFLIGVFAVLCAVLAIYFVLGSEHALVVHPKGIIARSELNLIITNILLMLIVIFPAFILLLIVAWRYRAKNAHAKYEKEQSRSILKEVLVWIIPSTVIGVMIVKTWAITHELDPYQPIKSDVKPLTIQVVALDWKWLFIYPEQEIASLNFVQFPDKTPIRFELAADGSPMNSFWIPELSGQIYSMTGMVTPLHIMADAPGIYAGRAAEINGDGYADMTFVAKSSSQSDFETWVDNVKEAPLQLTDEIYEELTKRSINTMTLYSHVEKDLFNKIVMKYMHHH